MPRNIGFVIGAFMQPQILAQIENRRYPIHEYILFLRRNHARAFYYDDLKRLDPERFEVLKAEGSLAWGMPRVVSSVDPPLDTVLATGEDVGLPLALDESAQKHRLPLYVITHGFVVRYADAMEAVRCMDHVRFLCLSEQLKTMLVNKFGVPESRVTNTGYGVDTRFFRPAKDSSFSKPLIVSAGAANRDYRTFVNAVETLAVDVKIAADSAWCPTVIDIDIDRLPPHIEVHSQGDYSGLRELYAKASFIVVPLLPAPFACGYAVIAEAMAMGKAVIATQTESHSDFVIDGETGYYVRPGDVQDLREKIEYLLAHPAWAREMGQRAQLRIEQNFSVEKYCERLEREILDTG